MSKKSLCPIHGRALKVRSKWVAPDGFDPKMKKLVCILCSDYWYKAPKHCLMRWDEVQAEFILK